MAVRSPFCRLFLMLLGLALDRASSHAFNPSCLQQHKVLHLHPNMDFLSFFPPLTGRRTVAHFKPNTVERIVSGNDARPHSWPWQVSLQRHEHFRYPAHSELDYDIALVKAATDIQSSNFIHYACLPRKQINLKPGHYCWVSGWGDTRGGKENVSLAEALNQAQLPIIDYKTCRQKKFWGDHGDSGGPLLCQVGRDRWEVYGIVSFGPIGCTVENKPSVFNHTTAYIPWIEATRIRDFFLQ
ncbi:hypothetical protein cypCar_00006916 [Cyprinus carpio]|nr:hypothetical protein cypCar_00006916 [Cyprinus carpio]